MVTGHGDNSLALCVERGHSAKQTPWHGTRLTAKVKGVLGWDGVLSWWFQLMFKEKTSRGRLVCPVLVTLWSLCVETVSIARIRQLNLSQLDWKGAVEVVHPVSGTWFSSSQLIIPSCHIVFSLTAKCLQASCVSLVLRPVLPKSRNGGVGGVWVNRGFPLPPIPQDRAWRRDNGGSCVSILWVGASRWSTQTAP